MSGQIETCQHGKPITEWCGDCWVRGDTDADAKRAARDEGATRSEETSTSFRVRNVGGGYWTVEEFISNQFCGHWHALLTSSHDSCRAYVRARS